MKVYMFSDLLKSIHGAPLSSEVAVAEIENISKIQRGLVSLKGRTASVCSLSKEHITIEFIDNMPEKLEVRQSNEITCPHCGSEVSDSWECDDEEEAYTCETCSSVFSYTREVEVTYNSSIVEINDNIQKIG